MIDTAHVLAGIGLSGWLPVVLFVLCLLDGFFPPVPSETAVMAALTLALGAGANPAFIATLIAAAAVGAASGDSVAYAIGRVCGTDRWRWQRRPRVRRALDWAAHQVSARPAILIIGARYIPIGRVAVNMTAGATRLPYRRFLPLSLIAGIMWAGMCWLLGTVISAWLGDQPVIAAIVAVAVSLVLGAVIDGISRLVSHLRARRAARRAPVTPVIHLEADHRPPTGELRRVG
ncbi:DedA family protein [Microbacterium gorillae]|uniref:DedA family protein n=1 Tax=Microbacterium gorillae TaxID=1231063 RepID=UPI0006949BE4|nr:VTT domain-containing protein [Microbacterium gorillae]